jgi:hypothetical protein
MQKTDDDWRFHSRCHWETDASLKRERYSVRRMENESERSHRVWFEGRTNCTM